MDDLLDAESGSETPETKTARNEASKDYPGGDMPFFPDFALREALVALLFLSVLLIVASFYALGGLLMWLQRRGGASRTAWRKYATYGVFLIAMLLVADLGPTAFSVVVLSVLGAALFELARLGPCPLERAERLEQLRALWNGIPIHVAVGEYASLGIDTPEDLERARRHYGDGRV